MQIGCQLSAIFAYFGHRIVLLVEKCEVLQIMTIFVSKMRLMEEKDMQTIDIRRILSLASIVDEYNLGQSFILGETTGERVGQSRALLNMLQYPVRFDGYMIFFLRKGRLQIDFNLMEYEVKENSLLMVVPGNIVKLTSAPDASLADVDLYFALVSREFMSGIRFDFQKVFQDSLRVWNNPCLSLDSEHLSMADDYFHLARKVLLSGQPNRQEILGSLLTSFIYMTLGLWTSQLQQAALGPQFASARVQQLVERFLALVTEYHNTQRSMAFYADRLCLTPKYLSKLVKQATGRSAPDWIDSYVVLEAKNLLRYSDKSIKEIVGVLHFPNQSVFYKFFKAHTRMTPSAYRKGGSI